MRKVAAFIGIVALAGSGQFMATAANAKNDPPSNVTVRIVGTNIFKAGKSLTTTYRFPEEIDVAQGGKITFVNKTDDGHTVALVAAGDLPNSLNCPVCDAVNGAFFQGSGGNGPPSAAQLDNGTPADDESQADADATDTGALHSAPNPPPPSLPVLIEDFDTPSHTNPDHSVTLGDAVIMSTSNPQNGGGGPTQRTIQVTAAPGTYQYMCTFHPWMQGTLVVEAAA